LTEITKHNFWDTIEEWRDPSKITFEYCGRTSLYTKMYRECKQFDGWSHTFDGKNFSEELRYNLTTLSGAPMERWEYLVEVQFSEQGDGLATEDMDYWWTVPQKEDFPTIYKFMSENPEFTNPVLSKLGPNHQLLAHNHGPEHQWLFNLSINEPVGSKFAIYPTGPIDYKPGDIYKLYVNNDHAVVNGNETRYHLLFRGGR
jgi:hypothetical protein